MDVTLAAAMLNALPFEIRDGFLAMVKSFEEEKIKAVTVEQEATMSLAARFVLSRVKEVIDDYPFKDPPNIADCMWAIVESYKGITKANEELHAVLRKIRDTRGHRALQVVEEYYEQAP